MCRVEVHPAFVFMQTAKWVCWAIFVATLGVNKLSADEPNQSSPSSQSASVATDLGTQRLRQFIRTSPKQPAAANAEIQPVSNTVDVAEPAANIQTAAFELPAEPVPTAEPTPEASEPAAAEPSPVDLEMLRSRRMATLIQVLGARHRAVPAIADTALTTSSDRDFEPVRTVSHELPVDVSTGPAAQEPVVAAIPAAESQSARHTFQHSAPINELPESGLNHVAAEPTPTPRRQHASLMDDRFPPPAAEPTPARAAPVVSSGSIAAPVEPIAASQSPGVRSPLILESRNRTAPDPRVNQTSRLGHPPELRDENPVAVKRDVQLIAMQAEAPKADAKNDPFEIISQTGTIDVTVRRSVLLQTKFDIYRTAVVDPGICDIVQFSPRELSIIGRGIGATHMTFWFEGGQRPHTYLVTVKPDEEVKTVIEQEYQKLEDIVAELFPDSKVRLTVMADKLIVRGQAKDSEEAAQIMTIIRNQANGGNAGAGGGAVGGIGSGSAARVLSDWEVGQSSNNRPQLQVVNMLRVPGIQQVALRVKIAEVNRTAARGFALDVNGRVNFNNNPRGSALFLQSLLGLAAGTAGNGTSLLAQFDGDDIQVGIRYLQQHGVVRLISEPTLVTLSGTPATFVAGGEFAVPTVVGSAGLNAVTTDFRSFGAIINFIPTVLDKDRIRLQISPEFSQVNRQLAVGGTPGVDVRRVNTTVEMREGQTFAIAGLLEDNMRNSSSGKFPLFYPWLGSRDAGRNETELLILVTPELVHPMDPEEVPPLPGFDMTEPDNYQFFVQAKIEGTPTRDYRSTVWPRLRQRYNSGGTSMISGPFGHGQ